MLVCQRLQKCPKMVQIWRHFLTFFEKILSSQPVFSILQFRALWSHFHFSTFLRFFLRKLFRFSFLDIFKNVQFWKFQKTLQIKCFFLTENILGFYWKHRWLKMIRINSIFKNNFFQSQKIILRGVNFYFFSFLDIFQKFNSFLT